MSSLGSPSLLFSNRSLSEYNSILMGLLLTILFCLHSTYCLGQYDSAPPNKRGLLVASSELNEFDLAGLCNGAGADGTGGRLGRFGLTSDTNGSGSPFSNFAFVTSSYTADTGRYGDFSVCSRRMYYYRLNQDHDFVARNINEDEFHALAHSLSSFKGKNANYFSDFIESTEDKANYDSIGGCLLPIFWSKVKGISYTIFMTSSVGIVQNIPFTPIDSSGAQTSPCNYWGSRRLSNSSIISDWISAFSFSKDEMFVYEGSYLQGVLFKKNVDLQCLRGSGTILRYILVTREYFDSHMRSKLESLIAARPLEGGQKSFGQSSKLSEDFSKWMNRIVDNRGCH